MNVRLDTGAVLGYAEGMRPMTSPLATSALGALSREDAPPSPRREPVGVELHEDYARHASRRAELMPRGGSDSGGRYPEAPQAVALPGLPPMAPEQFARFREAFNAATLTLTLVPDPIGGSSTDTAAHENRRRGAMTPVRPMIDE